MPYPLQRRVALPLAIGSLVATSIAQCPILCTWGAPQPELSGYAKCSGTWDPDGTGPLPLRLVIGGRDLIAGATTVGAQVVSWDGSQWEAVGGGGPGQSGEVNALEVWNDTLIAGGTFHGGTADRIAQWNGSLWVPLPGYPYASVAEMKIWNGDLITMTGSGALARWNGVSWSTLPSPPAVSEAYDMVPYQGHLCVAGWNAVQNVGVLARWNGTSWLPTIAANDAIHALAVRPSTLFGVPDTLYACGEFTTIGGAAVASVAATSGGTAFSWSSIGSGLTHACYALRAINTGLSGFTLVGAFDDAVTPVRRFQSGGAWTAMGYARLSSITRYDGVWYGTNAVISDAVCHHFDGAAWVPVRGPGIVGDVRAAVAHGDDVIVGGQFGTISGVAVNNVARWNGTSFQPLGAGTSTTVETLLTLANGDVVAGGAFGLAGGVTVNRIARWNGTAWSAFGTGMNTPVLALAQLPNGDLVAGGRFSTAGGVACSRIARWNGSAWVPLGAGANDDVLALAVRGDGVLFAGGKFTTAGGSACSRIAQWNGTTWAAVGTGCNDDVNGLAVRPNGDVVAVGAFTSAGGLVADRVARWTGGTWAAMGASTANTTGVHAVLALPDGDVVAGRGFHQPTLSIDSGLSRWNGTSWTPVAGGLGAYYPTVPVVVRALAQRASGELVVGGDFHVADGSLAGLGGIAARSLAQFESTCMPLVDTAGSSCPSPGGGVEISADSMPWIGATFRTTTTGITPGSLCLGVIGLTAISVPLDAIFAEAVPGCQLYAAPDILMLLGSGPGTAISQFALANDTALLGVTFFQQTLPLEFDALGALAVVRGSNRLIATIGTL